MVGKGMAHNRLLVETRIMHFCPLPGLLRRDGCKSLRSDFIANYETAYSSRSKTFFLKWIIGVTTKSMGKCININDVFPNIKMLLCYINVCKSPQHNNSLLCTLDGRQLCSNRCNQWRITDVFASYLVCTLPTPWQDETRLQLLNLQRSLRTTSDCSSAGRSKQSSDTTVLPGLRLMNMWNGYIHRMVF